MIKRLLIRYEWVAILGVILAIFAMLKVFGVLEFSSDVFWAIAGLEVAGVAAIELFFESREDTFTLKIDDLEHSNDRYEELANRMNNDPSGAVVTISHGNIGVTMSFHTFRSTFINSQEQDETNE